MNKYQKMSLSILIGFPLFFAVISVFTGNWMFFVSSLPPSFLSGMTGYFVAKKYG